MLSKTVYILVLLTALFAFSGCFNVGYEMTYCQEHGCDYKDAGVCGNSYDIYKNWKKVEKEAYKGFKCNQGDIK